jgi:uncharacterized protein YkwD
VAANFIKPNGKIHMNKTLFSIALVSILAACGGGGGDSTSQPSAAQPPVPVVVPVVGNDFSSRQPVTSVPTPSYAVNSFQSDAFVRLNSIRSSVGLGLLAQNTNLDNAAAAHSKYMNLNGLADNVHVESAGKPGFTGARVGDRIGATSYGRPTGGGEVISFVGSAKESIDGLIAAVYHRMVLLQYRPKEIGIGFLQTSTDKNPLFNTYNNVFNLAYADGGQGAPAVNAVVWPADNSTTTSVSMPAELPRPGIPGASGVFGYPVSISVDEDRVLVPTTFTLTDNTGATVSCNLVSFATDPNMVTFNNKSFVAVVPRDSLKAASTYTVQFVGNLDGAPFSRSWSFKTP